MVSTEDAAETRRSAYRLMIFVVLAIAAARIAVVTRDGYSPFLSANDRSRWATVAALVEHGTYVIDSQEQITVRHPVTKKPFRPWATIDKVKHIGHDGELHSYSSKPPLFPTMVAAVYAVVRQITGTTLTDHPMYVGRMVLAIVNLPLLALFCVATMACIERLGEGQWSRIAAACSVCFGTMLLPFSISLNNHLPAASATAVVMWIYLFAGQRLRGDSPEAPRSVGWGWWFLAGAAAAFTVANELPALSMLGLWGLLFLVLQWRSVLPFAVGAAAVAIAFFATNYAAHQDFKPPYTHRGNGDSIAERRFEVSIEEAGGQQPLADWLVELDLVAPDGEVRVQRSARRLDRWRVDVPGERFGLLAIAEGTYQLRTWDDWYDYEGTHWTEDRPGIDRGEASRASYFAHLTIGHHGLFSLTPIWLLVPVGLVTGLFRGTSDYRRLVAAVLIASAVCIAFYVARPTIDRNYGGVSVCFRWLLWFAPLWLLVSIPVVDRFSALRGFRLAFLGMLAFSVFSAATALANPWQHPWLYRLWAFFGMFGLEDATRG